MLSCIGTKSKKKKYKAQRDEMIEVAKKIYKNLHTVNCELKEYTQEHNVIIINPNDYEMTIIEAIKLYQKRFPTYLKQSTNLKKIWEFQRN